MMREAPTTPCVFSQAKTIGLDFGSLALGWFQQPMNEDTFLRVICDDDRATLKRLLRADPALATRRLGKARLFRTKILHWIYVGDTPLHLAAAGHRVEMVRSLLAAGANPNSHGNHRRSGPLHYASDGCPGTSEWNPGRQVKTIQCLIEAGADIHAQDKNGASPLHRAVRTRCAAAVRCLLDAGCDPALKNKPGSTPFHLAVQNTGRGGSGSENAKIAQREIVEEFLSRGLSVDLNDSKGKSVRDWAKAGWLREMLSE